MAAIDHDSRDVATTQWHGRVYTPTEPFLEDPREQMRELRGDFAVMHSDQEHVWFCTDSFSTHPLWYHYDTDRIHVASRGDVIRAVNPTAWRARANHIYRWHRRTGALTHEPRRPFDLRQHTQNYDRVFEKLENAVRERFTDDAVTLMGSGYDTGVMLAAARSVGLSPATVVAKFGERNRTLADRMRLHGGKFVKHGTVNDLSAEIERLTEIHYGRFNKSEESRVLLAVFRNHMDGEGAKAFVSPVGGDEFHADYGYDGTPIRADSNFGGRFPEDLDLVWPWHGILQEWLDRDNALACLCDVERRYPLLDHDLVQAWLSTTHLLKNNSHKDWMRVYMTEKDYPFQEPDKKYAPWRRDTADRGRELMPPQRNFKEQDNT